MLKLPKIDEEDHPLKKQYRQAVLSKFAQFKSQRKDKASKFDWIRCQINFVDRISKEAILREMIRFQIVCKKKEIPLFYSYFFTNSLLLNKDLIVALPDKPKTSEEKERKSLVHIDAPLNQVEIFIVQSLKQQVKKMQEEKSAFHKIQNYVTLRQDLLRQIQKLSKQQTQNLIHEHVDDLRFMNLQIVDLVRAWKEEHKEMQEKTFQDLNTELKPFEYSQPIFFKNDQNYMGKMVYDNGIIINTANQRKLSNFISPPNPFFLSSDGNIQLMGQKLKENIESAMGFFAEQKANQLKLLLEQPEYVAKGKSLKDKITNFRLNTEKGLNAKSESIKKIYGPAGKHETHIKTNGFNFNEKIEQNPQERKKYSSLYAKKQQTQTLTAYHTITSKLRQQAEILSESRAKFQRIVSKSSVELVKNLSRKQSRPKQQFHMLKQEIIQDQAKNLVNPYKQKISSLRRQVEKNVASKKLPKEQSMIISQQAFLSTERNNSTKNPLNELATSKSKIKMITERQTSHQAFNSKSKSFLIKKTLGKQDQAKVGHKDNKNQITRKNSFPSNFGRSQDKQQKTILKLRLSSTGKLKQTFHKSPQKIEEERKSLRQQTIGQMKQDTLEKIPQHTINHPQVRNQRQSGYFLYKPQKLSKQLLYYLNLKRKTMTPEIGNFNQSRSGQNNGENQRNIDIEIKNLKQRLRDMEIMKIYGPKQSNPPRKQLQNNYVAPREEIKEEKLKDNSRHEQRKERIKFQQTLKQQTCEKQETDGQQVKQSERKSSTSPNRNRLSVIQRETAVLQKRIQKLLKKKEQSKPLKRVNLSIQEEVHRVQRSPPGKNERLTDKQVKEKFSESKVLLQQNLQKLRKKQELMQQGNQMTKREIESNKKTKQQISSELQMKDKRLNQLEERISEMKKKRESIAQQTEEKLSESVLDQKLQSIITEEAASIRTLKIKQSTMKKQNKNLQEQMKVEEEKFIQLKQAEYKMREEINTKKYLDSIEEIKSQYLSKQQQYEDKILDEEKQRKEHEIQLIIEKRQAEELKMRLLEQTMKELLLKEILQNEQQRHARYEQQADQYESEVRRKIEHEIREKEEFERRLAENFQEENLKMLSMINQIKEKNKKLQQANKRKIQQVDRTILEKEQETKKLQLLEMEVQKIEEEEEMQKNHIQSPQKIEESYEIIQDSSESDIKTSPRHEQILEEKILLFQEDQKGMEMLKLKVREEILQQMQQRRKKEEEEEKKFEEERKKRLKILEEQIKEFMRKEGEIVKKIEEGKFDQVDHEMAQLKGRDQCSSNSPQEKQQPVIFNRRNSRLLSNSLPQVQSTLSMVQIYNYTFNSENQLSQDEVQHRHKVQIKQQSQKLITGKEQLSLKNVQKPQLSKEEKPQQVDKFKQISIQELNNEAKAMVKESDSKQVIIIKIEQIKNASEKLQVKKGEEKLKQQEIRDQRQIVIFMRRQSDTDEKQKLQSELKPKKDVKDLVNNSSQNLTANNMISQPQISKIEQKKQQVNKGQSQNIVGTLSSRFNHNKVTNQAVEIPIKKIVPSSEQRMKFSSQQKSVQKVEKSPVLKQKVIQKTQSPKVHVSQKIQGKENSQLPQVVLKNLQQDKNQVQDKQQQINNVKPAGKLMKEQKSIKSTQNLTNKTDVQQRSQVNKKNIQLTSVKEESKQPKKQLSSLIQQKKPTQTKQLYPIPVQLEKRLHNQSPEILTHDTYKIPDSSEKNKTKEIEKQASKEQKNFRAKELTIFQVPQEDYKLQKKQEKQVTAQNKKTEHIGIKQESKQMTLEPIEKNEKPQQSKVSQIQTSKNESQPTTKNEGAQSSLTSIKAAEKIPNKIEQKSQESLEKTTQHYSTIHNNQQSVSDQKIKESVSNVTLKNQSLKPIQISSNKRKQSQSQNDYQNRQDESKSVKSAVKRSNEQVFQKYEALQPFLNMKVKFILIEEHQLKSHIAKFYASLPQEVSEMLPYTQRELEIILRKYHRQRNKIDLFSCNSIGWYEQQKNKYILLGQIQCIHLIVQKYGEIQIELAHVLDKANLPQKQYLAKKLKFFAQIGYVYQKRMKDQALFSVKIIIKIPKQIVPKGFIKPTQLMTFNSQITLLKSSLPKKSLQKEAEPEMKHNNVFWHLLGDCISNQITKQKLEQLLANNTNQSVDINSFVQSIQQSQSKENMKKLAPFISRQNDLTSEFQISFDLPSIQLGAQMFLSIQAKEFTLKNSQKFYLGSDEKEKDENKSKSIWKFLIFETDKSILKENYLETYLANKVQEINASKSKRELNLMIPGFVIKSTLKLKEEEDFKQNLIHRSNIMCNLLPSSISNSDSITDQETNIITLSKENPENGFVFCLCYCPEAKIEKVMAGSWIGFQDQTIYDQLFAETKK